MNSLFKEKRAKGAKGAKKTNEINIPWELKLKAGRISCTYLQWKWLSNPHSFLLSVKLVLFPCAGIYEGLFSDESIDSQNCHHFTLLTSFYMQY